MEMGKEVSLEAGCLKPGENRMQNRKKPIVSFTDLDVYQITYETSLTVLTKLIPKLPKEERYDLADQLRRSCKAIPRLIAEGYGKKHQHKGFQKYLDDALGEINETVVSLSHCKDVYNNYVNKDLCEYLISEYNKAGKMTYNLNKAWKNFNSK